MTRENADTLETISLDEAIQLVREKCHNQYAVKYAETVPEIVREQGTMGLVTQIGYILCNINDWRGEDAKKAKKALRDYYYKHL